MFSGSITVLIVLVAFFSPGTVSGQNSTAITPNSTVTHNVTESTSSQSSQAITPSSVSSAPLPSASVSANTTETTTTTTTTTKQTTEPATEPTPEPTPEPTGSTTTPPEKLRTCANLSVIVEMEWNEMFTDKLSQLYQNHTKLLTTSLRNLYIKSADGVELTKVKFTEEAKQVLANAILHLFVISENEGIKDMFIKKVKSGKLSEDLQVKNDSARFELIGVTFNWKAEDGECEKKCEGAGGPFVIERKCQAKRYSCKGHKNKSDNSKNCVKYCPSESSNAAITVPSFILAIGIFLSFSFQ